MRSFLLNNACQEIQKYFEFLHAWGFKLCSNKSLNYACVIIYDKDGVNIELNYDYRDNFFYFQIQRGEKSMSLMELFKQNEPDLNLSLFQPTDLQYEYALKNNVKYFMKYEMAIINF